MFFILIMTAMWDYLYNDIVRKVRKFPKEIINWLAIFKSMHKSMLTFTKFDFVTYTFPRKKTEIKVKFVLYDAL